MFEIREATADDGEAMAALARAMQALHAAALPHVFKPVESDAYPAAVVQAWFGAPDRFCYVAMDEGAVVGYVRAEVRYEPETPLKYSSTIVYVRQLAVAATHQRRGIGRQLLDTIRRRAAARGLRTITLNFYAFNEQARTFYARYGFTSYREDLRLR